MSDSVFTYVTHIQATPEAVWEALTSPDFTEQYWGGRRITSDWKVGAEVRHVRPDGGTDWQGEVLVYEPPKELAYTWEAEGEAPTKVTFKLMPQGPNIRLMLLHEGLDPTDPDYNMATEGWTAILSSLKTLVETGEALAFPHWQG